MKRNKFKIITLIALALAALFALAACSGGVAGPDGQAGIQGEQGEQGEQGVAGTDAKGNKSGGGANSIVTPYYDLDEDDNVYKTLQYHDFYHLLTNPRTAVGEYLVLLGGTHDAQTQGVIGLIDGVAKAKGIREIYLFDPYLDNKLSEKIVGVIGGDPAVEPVDPDNIGRVGYTGNIYGKTGNGRDDLTNVEKFDIPYDDLEISKFTTNTSGTPTALAGLQGVLTNPDALQLNEDGTVKTPQLLVVQKQSLPQDQVTAAQAAAGAGYNIDASGQLTLEAGGAPLSADQKLQLDILAGYENNDYTGSYGEDAGFVDDAELIRPTGSFSRFKATIKAQSSDDTATDFDDRKTLTTDFINVGQSGAILNRQFLFEDQYKDAVSAYLTKNLTTASLKTDFDIFTVKNQRQTSGGGSTRLKTNKYFETASYERIIATLEKQEEALIYWGGLWCPNSTVYYSAVQQYANETGYEGKVLLFDPKLAGGAGTLVNDRYIRDYEGNTASSANPNGTTVNPVNPALSDTYSNLNSHARLYAYLIDNFFPQYASAWNSIGGLSKVTLSSGNLTSTPTVNINDKQYTRIVVPAIFDYNPAVQGNVVTAVEVELTWNKASSGTAYTGLTGNLYSEQSTAFAYRERVFRNFFAFVGASSKFIEEGYEVSVKGHGLENTLTVKKDGASADLTTYFYTNADTVAAGQEPTALAANKFFSTKAYAKGGDSAFAATFAGPRTYARNFADAQGTVLTGANAAKAQVKYTTAGDADGIVGILQQLKLAA
ncbi:MAG: hypothetical protein LBL66_06245 [Clostridiales bacterium]|jgi:hypothetical protein|nr:hypothetical protein [Clostridiales bacterium]